MATKSVQTGVRFATHALLVIPFFGILFAIINGDIYPDPAKVMMHKTGEWAIRIFILTLFIRPFANLIHANWLISIRRPVGLWMFFYAVLHLTSFAVLYVESVEHFLEEVEEHPYILHGLMAFTLLIPLAATSTLVIRKKLGPEIWSNIHQLIFPAAILAVWHIWGTLREEWLTMGLYTAFILVALIIRNERIMGWLKFKTKPTHQE